MQCRARLKPEDVGLVSAGRRRVPGLRREEVAVLAGITPAWYTQLETGCDIRVSARLLDRIAASLKLSDEEKVYLFSLSIDELSVLKPTLRPQSLDVLEAFTSLRVLSQRLWVATTEEEALTITREHCVRTFALDVMVTAVHTGLGKWNIQRTGDTAAVRQTFEISAHIIAKWPPALRDELHLLRILKRPGDLLTRSEAVMSPDLASHFARDTKNVKWPNFHHVMMAAIHSRSGFVARLEPVLEKSRLYSKMDRAIMSAIADLTSLALVDAPSAENVV
jgi:transcriptional regulator with XRE-family HTH domain